MNTAVAFRNALSRLRRRLAPRRGAKALLDARVWTPGVLPPDPAPAPAGETDRLDPELAPLLGEFAWHSLTLDPTLREMSESHYAAVARLLAGEHRSAARDARVLEVAAYAHTTGYLLCQRLGARTDLLDISPSALRLGRRMAREQQLPVEGTRCVAADFHHLPYADDQFDLVYICSALHHTWRWRQVLSEMVRVLAPGGLLLLENEPCRRRFCHYLFRANRAERSAFEQALDRLGILRTIAEPFPGTRPEALFGMVENQTIPIGTLCRMLAADCTPVAFAIEPEVCMGALEQAMVARRRDSACAQWLVGEVARRVDEARTSLSDADRGMGFALPSRAAIEKLCTESVAALAELPSGADSPDFRVGLADLFGASMHITVRKNGARRLAPAARMSRDYATREDVVYAFPPRIARLLDPRTAALPDIQSAPADMLDAAFPASDWTLTVSATGLRALTPTRGEPGLVVPVAEPGPLLVVVRLHVVVDGRPYRVMLCAGDVELAGFDAYHTDSLLLKPIVAFPPGASRLRLSIRTRMLDATAVDDARIFNVSYAGAFPLQEAADAGAVSPSVKD